LVFKKLKNLSPPIPDGRAGFCQCEKLPHYKQWKLINLASCQCLKLPLLFHLFERLGSPCPVCPTLTKYFGDYMHRCMLYAFTAQENNEVEVCMHSHKLSAKCMGREWTDRTMDRPLPNKFLHYKQWKLVRALRSKCTLVDRLVEIY
jgi:hypothetical protein